MRTTSGQTVLYSSASVCMCVGGGGRVVGVGCDAHVFSIEEFMREDMPAFFLKIGIACYNCSGWTQFTLKSFTSFIPWGRNATRGMRQLLEISLLPVPWNLPVAEQRFVHIYNSHFLFWSLFREPLSVSLLWALCSTKLPDEPPEVRLQSQLCQRWLLWLLGKRLVLYH